MAEQINIKLLIDAAESAKTVAETKKALRDLKTAAMSVEEGSAAFNEINMAAGQLQDRIGDLQATTKYFANDMRKLEGLTGIAEGIAGGFALAQGAAQLFGGENKNLEASLTKLTSIMSVLNGLQAVGNVLQKESAASLFISNTIRKTAIALTSEQAAAEAAEAVAAGTATVAQRALNAAMNANPIGILVTAILAGVAALTLWTSKSEDAKKEEEKRKKIAEQQIKLEKERREFISKESSDFTTLIYQLKATNVNSTERLDLIKKINEEYGTTLQNLQDESKFQEQLNGAVDDYIALQYNRFILTKNQAYIDSQNEKKFEATVKKNKAIAEADALVAKGLRKSREDALSYREDLRKIIASSDKDIKEAENALKSLGNRRNELINQQNQLTNNGTRYVKQTKDTTKTTKEETNAVSDLTQAYIDLAESVREANYDINEMATGEGLKSSEQMIAIKKLENEKILEDLKQSNKERLKSFEDAYIQEQKKLKENKKVSDDILRTRAQSDAKYKEAVVVFAQEEADKKKKLEEDLTKFIEEEQLRRAALVEQYTKQILTTPEWKRFLDFSTELSFKIGEIEKNLSSTSFGLREVDGQIQKVTTSMVKLGDVVMSAQRVEDVQKVTEAQLAGAKNIIQTSVGESSDAIDLLASIYQGKLEKINEITAKINEDLKLAGEKMTFAIEPVGPDQFGLDQLVNKYEDGALKLSNALEVQYKKLTANEAEVFNKSLFDAYDNYEKKITLAGDNVKERRKVEKEYLDEVEKAQEDHNDRMLLIDVAYGKASTEQMVDNFKSKKEKRDAQNQKTIDQQKKLNEELLALEAQVQQLLLQLFEQYQEKRNRAAQDRYDAEIERIDAEQKKYEDSIANRTASEQAQLDIEAGFDEQRKNAEDNLKIEQNKIAEKTFNAQKANDATTIAIQTAVAIAKTIAELGGVGALTPPGIALIAAVAAQGIAAEALVLTKEFVPQYAEGGLVVGPGSGTSDSINAKLSNGESVINAKSTRMFAPILSAINQAGGGKAIPNLATGGLVTTGMTTSTNNDFQELKDAIYSLADRPIETYVKQTVVTNAQDTARKIKNRTTFG